MISIIHPTRQRPEKSFATIQKWVQRCSSEVEVVVSVDIDDPLLNIYQSLYKDIHKVIVNKNRSAVDAVNAAAKECTGNIMVVVSDDFDCNQGWGREIIRIVKDRKDWVLKANDGVQKWIITLPILDREYYNRFGYVYHPDFIHMFVDTWFTHQAEALGKILRVDTLWFPHLHYSVVRSNADEVSRRADKSWNQGKALYLHMVRQQFKGIPKYGIKSPWGQGHIQWLQRSL